MRRWIKYVLFALLVTPPALALTLSEARQQGKVGEMLNGYLAPVQQDRETLALVSRINQRRAAEYQQVAQRNNLSTAEVGRIAGEKLVQRAAPGEYVRGINGQWLRK